MLRGMPLTALYPLCDVNDPLRIFVILVGILQIRAVLHGAVDCHTDTFRDIRRQHCTIRSRVLQNSGNVFNGLLRRKCAKGNDATDIQSAVFLNHVLDDFGTSDVFDIRVDIRVRHTFRVQKSLKQQIVLDWVKVGDAHTVSDHRACCGASPGSNIDIVGLCPVDEVPNDDEVSGELHLLNHFDFVIETFLVFFGMFHRGAIETFVKPFCGNMDHVFFGILEWSGDIVFRQVDVT